MENLAVAYDYEAFGPLLADKGIVEERALTVDDLTEEVWNELYIKQDMKMKEIAKLYGTWQSEVSRKATKNNWVKKKFKIDSVNLTKDIIEDLYYNKNMTYQEICDMHNLSFNIGYDFFKRVGIKTKPLSFVGKQRAEKYKKQLPIDELKNLVEKCDKSLPEIAEYFNVSVGVVRKRSKDNNISTKGAVEFSLKRVERLLVAQATGHRNPNWKGGVTTLREQIRKLPKSKDWTRKCLERDNFKCQECGKNTNCLQVDHIKPFSYICDKNNIKSKEEALACEELWDLSNGRTLCKECHFKTDTWGERAKTYKEETN